MNYKTLEINEDTKQCLVDGVDCKLTKTEYELLKFFLENTNKIFSRGEIIHILNLNITERAVDTNITRLRKKIQNYSNNLETRRGYGYGFIE